MAMKMRAFMLLGMLSAVGAAAQVPTENPPGAGALPPADSNAPAFRYEGFKRIVVLPMFIAQGGHLKHDLPQIIDELRAAYPQVTFEQADALGDADAIVHAIVAHVLALAGV